MCVRPQAINNYSCEVKTEITNETSPTAFQFLYMTPAVNITDRRGLSNEGCPELLPKESKV